MKQEKAKQNIEHLKEVYRQYVHFYNKKDQLVIRKYLDLVDELYNEGAFYPECKDLLLEMDWSRFNVRHGANSIRGVVSEALAMGLMNLNNTHTQFKLNDGKKEEEVRGVDLWAYRPNWKRQFSVQVKTVLNLERFRVQPEWRDYKRLDRFVIADPDHNRVLHMDYPAFKEFSKGRTFLTLRQLMNEPSLKACLYE